MPTRRFHLLLIGLLLTNPLLCRLGAVESASNPNAAIVGPSCCATCGATACPASGLQQENASPQRQHSAPPLRECPAGGVCQCVSAGAILDQATHGPVPDGHSPLPPAAAPAVPMCRDLVSHVAPWDASIESGQANRGRDMRCRFCSLLC